MSRDIAEWLALGTAHPVDPANVGRGRRKRISNAAMKILKRNEICVAERKRTILDAWMAREYKCAHRETQFGTVIVSACLAPTRRELAWSNLSIGSEFVKLIKETEIVYIVQPESVQRVKIGSTCNVASRITELQVGCPFKLRLVAQMACIKSMEFMIHEAFDAERAHGEWFELSPRLVDFIGHVRTGNKQAIYEELRIAIAANAEKRKGG